MNIGVKAAPRQEAAQARLYAQNYTEELLPFCVTRRTMLSRKNLNVLAIHPLQFSRLIGWHIDANNIIGKSEGIRFLVAAGGAARPSSALVWAADSTRAL